MADQGSGGAFEISQRMTAMLGWGATTKFSEDWTWNQAAETYALDPDMAAKLRKNNPQVQSAVNKQVVTWEYWLSRMIVSSRKWVPCYINFDKRTTSLENQHCPVHHS